MRILIVSNQYSPVIGGIEVFLHQFAPELRARGHDVAVLTGTHKDAPESRYDVDGVPVFRNDIVRALARRDAIGVARCRRAARSVVAEFGPDVVHAHDCGPILWAVAAAGIPVITTVHTSFDLYLPDQLDPIARQLDATSWLTAVSSAVLAEVVEHVPSLADRASVVPNGVPVPPGLPTPPPATKRIVALGRMVPQKGFDVLLAAFVQIADQHPDAELVLVGDGRLRGELSQLAIELGIASKVRMPGAIRHEDVADLLSSAALVAMPSRFEGMPLVALEAALAARPVVATGVHGLGEVVVHDETGVLVPVDDAGALATSIMELLDDPGRAARLGRAARERVVATYSFESTVLAYEQLYERVISEPCGVLADGLRRSDPQ